MKDLETEHLLIRRFKKSDVDNQFQVVSNNEVAQYSDYKVYNSKEDVLVNIESAMHDYYSYEACWAIEEKNSQTVIGHIRIIKASLENKKCSLMWSIGTNWWGKGYSEEVLKSVIKYLFTEHPFEIITLSYYSSNPYWGPILENVGFKKDAILRSRKINPATGIREDLIVYSILKNEVNW